MSTQNPTDAASNQANPAPPGREMMGALPITVVALYLVAFSILVLYGLIKVWPHPTPGGLETLARASPSPTPTASPSATPRPSPLASPTAQVAASPAASPGTAAGSTTTATTPTPSPTASPSPAASVSPAASPTERVEFISFFGGWLTVTVYSERRLLLLVMLTGALGSLMHALRSLYWYTGNREMVWSWAALYFLLPFTGAILAVIFYLVVRGGFFSPQGGVESTSPFGFAALSALVGLFSPQATLKLKDIAETIFTKPGEGKNAKPQATVAPPKGTETTTTAPQVTSVKPNSGQATQETPIEITGQGFANGVQVRVGDAPAKVVSSTSTSIKATAPTRAAGPGAVNVEVINPNGEKTTLSNGYTYS